MPRLVKRDPLKKYYNADTETAGIYEIGVDEAGRGPLVGRVYTAAVILGATMDCTNIKDSKKFHSKKKIEEVAEYIKENALAWHVSYETEQTIDAINILQATQRSMHDAIREVMHKNGYEKQHLLLIDGNYFNDFTYFNKSTDNFVKVPHITIECGDNKYAAIAAASILAKVERDKYIGQLCAEHPQLVENYGIDTNKGYGTKQHLEGIRTHGITEWHRKSFGICKGPTGVSLIVEGDKN